MNLIPFQPHNLWWNTRKKEVTLTYYKILYILYIYILPDITILLKQKQLIDFKWVYMVPVKWIQEEHNASGHGILLI